MVNVIVLVLDSLRQDHVGVYHGGRRPFPDVPAARTPTLDAVGRDSVVFANAYPEAVLHAGARKLPIRLEPVSDGATIARVSDAFLRKYVQWPNDARAMVREDVLPTTLRLQPIETL